MIVVVVLIIVIWIAGASRVDQVMLFHRLLHLLVRVDLCQSLLVDSLTGLFLLHNTENTVVQMLVEILGIAECTRASRALASRIGAGPCLGCCVGTLPPGIRGSLFHAMHGGQMTLEDICSVEALFRRRPRPRAKPADHGTFIVGQSVTVLVVLTSETFGVVFASDNGAFFRSFGLMR